MNPRWTHRPPGSTWGDFGPDDELGRLNLLTPAKILQGVAEIREGRAFCLSLPLDYPGGSLLNPRRHPPELRPTLRNGQPNMNYALRCDDPTATDIVCDDQALLTLQYSTQWDSLAHVGQMFDVDGDGVMEDVYYNGFRAGTDVTLKGAHRLGVENMAAACIQGRAVMIDLQAHQSETGTLIGYDELMSVIARDRIVIEPGDLVCLRTGFAQMLLGMNRSPDPARLHASTCALNGRDISLQQWITDSGAVAIIADNYGVEAVPAIPCADDFCATLPLHAHCLFRLGVYLGEMWLLTDLADHLRAQGRSRFLLTAPPLRLPGAVGSPVTPVATT